MPLTEANQLQKEALPDPKKAVKSTDIHRHKPARTAARAQPIIVMFFQSELTLDEAVTWVVELIATK